MPLDYDSSNVNREVLAAEITQEAKKARTRLKRKGWRGCEDKRIADTSSESGYRVAKVRMVIVSYTISLRHFGPTGRPVYLADNGKLYNQQGEPADLTLFDQTHDGFPDPLVVLLEQLQRLGTT